MTFLTIVSDREGSVLADAEKAGGGVYKRPLKARQALYECILFVCQLRTVVLCGDTSVKTARW